MAVPEDNPELLPSSHLYFSSNSRPGCGSLPTPFTPSHAQCLWKGLSASAHIHKGFSKRTGKSPPTIAEDSSLPSLGHSASVLGPPAACGSPAGKHGCSGPSQAYGVWSLLLPFPGEACVSDTCVLEVHQSRGSPKRHVAPPAWNWPYP